MKRIINTEVMKVTVKMPVIEQLEASSDASRTVNTGQLSSG
jgi:hypothetical protein